jgi:DNA-binding response OmpR family regulator
LAAGGGDHVKILIADDNTDNLYYLEVMLKAAGHEVASAHNGREALDHLSGSRFDLIISDILMPEMDGFQLCRECRKREDLDAIPFIFYTATYTDEKDKKLGLSIGADEYLIKPMEPNELLSVIDRVCAEAAGKREGFLADEEDYLTEHNKRLIAKLEKKMAQLEESKQELERQMVERRQAEELIRESEERFRTIFDTVSDAIFLQDIDTGLIVDMNRVTCAHVRL